MSESKFGRRYEEFEVGKRYEHWPGKTITESDNNLFCLLTMNHHPIHLDWNYAKTQKHGQILVVGTLVLSLCVGLTVKDVSGLAIANLEYQDIKHLAPTFVGDTIYAETAVLSKRISRSDRKKGVVEVQTFGINCRDEAVIEFKRKILVIV